MSALDFFVLGIVILIGLSVFGQTIKVVASTDVEMEKKSLACLKEFSDNNCNPFQPSEKCQNLISCVNEIDEPAWKEVADAAMTAFQQLEKLSIVPLLIIGLVLLRQLKAVRT